MSETTTELTAEPVAETIEQRFKRETANHELTILHDDGLYRHLSFRNPDTSAYWFELITVPHALIFRGDGDSYVFTRVEDMFRFFRDTGAWTGKRRINPGYWAEKITSGRDSVKQYDEQHFRRQVIETFVDTARYSGVPAGTGKALRDEVLNDPDIYHESGARDALNRFEHKGFQFHDTWEWDLRDWGWWFLWACHAIVWGIAQYDAERARCREAAVRAEAALAVNSVST